MPKKNITKKRQLNSSLESNFKLFNFIVKYVFQYPNFGDLIKDIKENCGESVFISKSDISQIADYLRRRGQFNLISEEDLVRYDRNIQSYLENINREREQKINLKYFQYFAILFSEIYLDYFTNKPYEFIKAFNEFFKEDLLAQDKNPFDFRKIAFFMATGSGKTIISHFNFYQFFQYKPFKPNSILYITPSEILSYQHYQELTKSGIPATLYIESPNSLSSKDKVLVIEITKLVEEAQGEGLSIPIDEFVTPNLIFVDEGHKGQKSEEKKWASIRNKLGENGFTFEYSATFAQILDPKKKEIFEEYCNSIIYDYSYKYFYYDGYGKNFHTFNISKDTERTVDKNYFSEVMFVANLILFYMQLSKYLKDHETAKEYNIEKPLWLFVGSSVTGEREESDVITIVKLINKFLKDRKWAEELIDKILSKQTGLKNQYGEDIFSFRGLPQKGEVDYEDIVRIVFNGTGPLKLAEIKNASDEITLRTGENSPFGLIKVDEINKLSKLLNQESIEVESDRISNPIFDSLRNEKDSSINILIGAKKFIEGWDTWRVSSLGLMNFGKNPGPQIIQLFGRGVRLRGKHFSLKRSGDEKVSHLETLYVLGIKADYLLRFLESIKKEEVEIEQETLQIPIIEQYKEKWSELFIPKTEHIQRNFFNKVIKLTADPNIRVEINLYPRLQTVAATHQRNGISDAELDYHSNNLNSKFSKLVGHLDAQYILSEILTFKQTNNLWNLQFNTKTLLDILKNKELYSIYAPDELLEIKSYEDILYLQRIAVMILKKYITRFYNLHLSKWEQSNSSYVPLSKHEPLAPFIKDSQLCYNVSLRKNHDDFKDFLEKIKEILRDFENEWKKDDSRILPRIYFDRSLFLPLLIKPTDKIKDIILSISPVPLNEGEEKCVQYIKNYLDSKPRELENFEIFFLRNFPRIGIGFQLPTERFYPDFILWIKHKNDRTSQAIVFIDPKSAYYADEEKIQFAKTLKEIQRELNSKTMKPFVLEAFIISVNSIEELRKFRKTTKTKEEFESENVLFLNDEDFPEKIFKKVLSQLKTLS